MASAENTVMVSRRRRRALGIAAAVVGGGLIVGILVFLEVGRWLVLEDLFDPRRWWRNTGDALDVVREMLGLFNAWAGLPLLPVR